MVLLPAENECGFSLISAITVVDFIPFLTFYRYLDHLCIYSTQAIDHAHITE
jgi:hypothetical protein